METEAPHHPLYTHMVSHHPLTFVVPLTPHLGGSAALSHCCEISPSLPLGSQEVVIRAGGRMCGKQDWARATSRWTSADILSSICLLFHSSFLSFIVQSLSFRMETCRIEGGGQAAFSSSDPVACMFVQAA